MPVPRERPDWPEFDRSLSADELPEIKQVEKTPRQLESPDWELRPQPLSLVSESDDGEV